MRDNKLTITFTQTILAIDLDSQKVVRTDGRRSRHVEHTDMDEMKLH